MEFDPNTQKIENESNSGHNTKIIKIDEGFNSSFQESHSLKSVNIEVEEIQLELKGEGSEL